MSFSKTETRRLTRTTRDIGQMLYQSTLQEDQSRLLDNYRNNSESYFEIKNMFDKKEYSKYIDGLKSYMDSIEDQKLKDRIEKNISDVEKYFKLDNDLEM